MQMYKESPIQNESVERMSFLLADSWRDSDVIRHQHTEIIIKRRAKVLLVLSFIYLAALFIGLLTLFFR